MTDADAEAKDPMQIAVAEAQEQFQEEIDNIKHNIQEKVEEVAQAALEKLQEMHPELAENLKPILKSKPTWKFDYGIEDERGVAINKRGSGTRRLVLLNFFRAQAEKNALSSKKGIIYAIEEPETSQHPDNQKLIIKTLSDLVDGADRQVMITTHSPELLKDVRSLNGDGIRFIQEDSSGEKEVIDGIDALFLSAGALGILSDQDFGSAKKIVLVEGRADCLFLEHVAVEMKKNGEIVGDFKDMNVETLPVGGRHNVRIWIELNKHENLGLDTYVFLDSDREDEKNDKTDNENFIDSLDDNDGVINAFCTDRREIENYISKELTDCEFGDYDDVKSIVPLKTGVNKRLLIQKFWTEMNAEDISDEIKEIVKDILS